MEGSLYRAIIEATKNQTFIGVLKRGEPAQNYTVIDGALYGNAEDVTLEVINADNRIHHISLLEHLSDPTAPSQPSRTTIMINPEVGHIEGRGNEESTE